MFIPAELMPVVQLAAKENSRYAVNGVLVDREPADEAGVSRARLAVTDGRAALIATWVEGAILEPRASDYPFTIKAAKAADFKVAVPATVWIDAWSAVKRDGWIPFVLIEEPAVECVSLAVTNKKSATGFTAPVDLKSFLNVSEVFEMSYSDPKATDDVCFASTQVGLMLEILNKIVGEWSSLKFLVPAGGKKPMSLSGRTASDIEIKALCMPVWNKGAQQ